MTESTLARRGPLTQMFERYDMTSLLCWMGRLARFRRPFHEKAVSVALAAFLACNALSFGAEAENGARWTRAPRSHFVSVVKETSRSVVSIQGEKQYEAGRRADGRDAHYDVFNGMGTGVVIDERGYILTNYHVVKGLLKLEVMTADGERYRDVELIRNDVATDLAILKIKPKKPLVKMTMGRAERLELAEDVFAIGNPYGYHCSVTRGIVSSIDRPLEVNETLYYDRVIQTDAAINPGNSGGPLINIDGEMVGLNAAVREEAENIAFAIPIDVVTEVAERMLRQSVAKMTHHGLKFRVVDPDMDDYPEDGDGRDMLIVSSVDPESPAANAGVKVGDALLTSNGYPMRSSLDFTCSLIGLGLSDSVEIAYERDGVSSSTSLAFSGLSERRERTIKTDDEEDSLYAAVPTADPYAESAESAPKPNKNSRAVHSVWNVLGVEVANVSAKEYAELYPNLQAVSIGEFNFAPNGGVLVERVDPNGLFSLGSVALQKGDLIFGFGVGEDKDGQLGITSLENLYYVAQRVDEFAQVDSGRARVYLIRGGKPYFLELDLSVAQD